MKIAVGIASYRRKDVLSETLSRMATQTRKADRIIVASPDPADVDLEYLLSIGGEFIPSEMGTAGQRNRILEALSTEDLILFLDDDFIPADDYLERLEALFLPHGQFPPIVVATGDVLADGILGRGLGLKESLEILHDAGKAGLLTEPLDVYNGYGCNMALSLKVIRQHQLRFDERLAAYGWWEDVDFTRQLRHFGRIVRDGSLRGVHRGVNLGRTTGMRYGFAQVVNPLYIVKKGNCHYHAAILQITRNVARNIVGIFMKDKRRVDRWGRFRGNLMGFAHILRGRLHPEEVRQIR